ncbi:hypothetical protein NM688_g2440 [Phlebia brevispora]|uniref:Uncharacterized protein n=1 Tax=Phlebia brevispora TaxID=194682 RepID=A0ACC1T8K8_9APHY|nr:hypothetical protein NM688_g2440 [Phlebia brevispora]
MSWNTMAQAIFELEIPKEWRFSRTSYLGRGPVWWSLSGPREQEFQDPMDKEEFSTCHRLRRCGDSAGGTSEREWPPTEGTGIVQWTGAATGADVPQELFDNVLKYIRLWDLDHKLQTSKRELGQISLVCRRWAKHIRPMIFAQIKLRTRDDAHTLLRFLRCPASVMSGYIHELDLKLSVSSYPYLPWVHAVCSVILPRLATTHPRMLLTVQGPLPHGKVMKGIHDMLPRSYPYFSSGLQELSLANSRFKSFAHLMRMVSDMPALENVDLTKVTWDRSTDEEFRPPPARHARFRQHPEYKMQECTDNAAVVWLRLLLLCPELDQMDQNDADRLYRTTSLLSNGSRSVRYRSGEDMGRETFNIVVALSRSESLQVHFWSLQEFVDLDWKEIDNVIASFPALETLLFAFKRSNVLPMQQDIIAQKMAHFKDSPRLKYALTSNTDWVRVSHADDGTIKEIGSLHPGLDLRWPSSKVPTNEEEGLHSAVSRGAGVIRSVAPNGGTVAAVNHAGNYLCLCCGSAGVLYDAFFGRHAPVVGLTPLLFPTAYLKKGDSHHHQEIRKIAPYTKARISTAPLCFLVRYLLMDAASPRRSWHDNV